MGDLSNIAVAIDLETDGDVLLEVGVTTFNWRTGTLEKTVSLAVCPPAADYEVAPAIYALTGWTAQKLRRTGVTKAEVSRRLTVLYGCASRLLVCDTADEVVTLEKALGTSLSQDRLNISLLYALLDPTRKTNDGMDKMLAAYGLTFEGKAHRGADDSANIARLCAAMFAQMRTSLPVVALRAQSTPEN